MKIEKQINRFVLWLDQIKERPALQKTMINTVWLFLDRFIRLGIGLFVGVWVARYLGPERYGLFSYAQAFVSIFAVLATLGLDSIVVRDIVRDQNSASEILGTAFILKLTGGFLTLILSISSILVLRPDNPLTAWLVAIVAAGTIFQAFDTIDLWFQAQVLSKYTVYAKNVVFLIVAFVKVGLIIFKAPLVAFALAGLAEIVLSALGLVLVYRFKGQTLHDWSGSFSRGKQLLKDCWPLILSGLAIYIQARIDQVMLGQMLGDAEVGQYSAAMRLIEVFGFIPMAIQSSVAPSITKAKVLDQNKYYNRLLNVYRLMFILFLVVSIPSMLFSKQIVLILFGNQYIAAAELLSLLSLRLFFTNFGVAKSLFITNENLFKYSLITAIVGAVFNISLNYLLIPKFASVGAIWASMISFSVTTFMMDIFFNQTRANLKIMLIAIISPWKLDFK